MNAEHFETPNPPLHRTSTVLFSSIAQLESAHRAMAAADSTWSMYGTFGTPTTQALERLILEREGGAGVAFAPSGLSAVALALLSVVESGDHILVPDSVYGPSRDFCDSVLKRLGVRTTYYDACLDAAEVARLAEPTTRVVFLESPGSYSFEVQDVPGIVRAVGGNPRVVTMLDNAWGSPGLFRPFDHGVDISIVPLTKYWGGHADLLAGAVVANERLWHRVRSAAFSSGLCTNAEEASLTLRGARSLDVRLKQHEESGLRVAGWLKTLPRVGRVLHPAFPDCHGHEYFVRDFNGSNGLFSFELVSADGTPASVSEGAAFADALVRTGRFGLGYSWGGFESLVMPGQLPSVPNMIRSVRPWSGGALIRLHIGLEPVEELLAALESAFAATVPGAPSTS